MNWGRGGLVCLMLSMMYACAPGYFSQTNRDVVQASSIGLSAPHADQALVPRWWETYGSDELNQLVVESLAQNLSVKKTIERVKAARSEVVIQDASRYPTASIEYKNDLYNDSGATTQSGDFSFLPSYTIDIWGANNAEYQRAKNLYISAEFEVKVAQMLLIEEVVSAWIDVKFSQLKRHVLENQLRAYQALLQYETQAYHQVGSTNQDILSSQIKVREYYSLLQKNRVDIDSQLYVLTYLLGRNPIHKVQISETPMREIIPLPAAGITSALLKDRPDIQVAWFQLIAADWQVLHSKLATLPSFSISADFSNAALSAMLGDWSSVATTMNYTMIDWGKSRAQTEQYGYGANGRMYNYIDTVYKAVLQVQNYMMRDTEYLATLKWNRGQYQVAKADYDDAMRHINKGENNANAALYKYIEFCNTALKVLQEEQRLNRNRIALYHAIGGNIWQSPATGGNE
jgi:multidrug efflux system outer membrane protein